MVYGDHMSMHEYYELKKCNMSGAVIDLFDS